jgi:predicted RNA-binding protein with PIN domain
VATQDAAALARLKGPGCTTSNSEQFIQTVQTTLADLERVIEQINEKENQKFTHHG